MGQAEHSKFDSEEGLCQAASAFALQTLAEKKGDLFSFALSGGRIAKPFYQRLASDSLSSGVDWTNAHFFWADERCVPPVSAESNYRDASEFLLGPLRIPPENIHRICGETDGDYAVSQAEAELCRVCPLDADAVPLLDLVFLGMGEDGHTASLFPAEPLAMTMDEAVYRAVIGPKPPPRRVTLGYQPLIRAREAMALVAGAGKKEVLERVLKLDDQLPLGRIVKARRRTIIFSFLQQDRILA
jgi:6-phosphogluconolactonase